MMFKLIFKRTFLLLAIVFGGALLMAAFAENINPNLFPPVSYFALIFPYLLIVNILLAFVLLFVKIKYALFPLVAMLICFSAVGRTFQVFEGKPKLTGGEIKVKILTYNTMNSFDFAKYSPKKPNCGYGYILAQNADIVLLQEFCASQKPEHITEADFKQIFKEYAYQYIWYRPNHEPPDQKSGLAIFSKFPIVHTEHIDLQSDYNTALFADIQIGDSIYRFFNLHLESNKITAFDNQKISDLLHNVDSVALPATAKFFAQKLSDAAKIRAGQAKQIAQLIKQSPYTPIVCGDFNDVPLSYTASTVGAGLKDAFVESGRGAGLTYNKGIYKFRIDYILYHKKLSTAHLTVDKVTYSDHYPVWCEMYFR